ncbi:MAG: transcription elongation factor GreA [candidate division Zixibacteria bacterium]|nr:transcription elongation factor GreA [candidate division Zixibacteria bacterium]
MKSELKRLKTVERPQIVSEISRARDLGDLSENAEYHAAKEKQVILERKISELEDKLRRIKMIPEGNIDGGRAYLLSFVTVKDLKSGEQIRYQLVSPEEADFDLDRISIHAPVGQGLLGKAKGDRVSVKVPAGELQYEILDVQRPK